MLYLNPIHLAYTNHKYDALDKKMTKEPTVHHNEYKQRIARQARQLMTTLIAVLAVPAFVLMFHVGQDLWPMWLLIYRSKLLGFLLFIEFILLLFSPIIIEFNANPRRLSGPGKNPELPPDMQ